jgi:hypothetical protein
VTGDEGGGAQRQRRSWPHARAAAARPGVTGGGGVRQRLRRGDPGRRRGWHTAWGLVSPRAGRGKARASPLASCPREPWWRARPLRQAAPAAPGAEKPGERVQGIERSEAGRWCRWSSMGRDRVEETAVAELEPDGGQGWRLRSASRTRERAEDRETTRTNEEPCAHASS